MSKKSVMKDWHEILCELKPHVPEPWCENQFGKRWNPIDNRNGVWSVFWTGLGVHEREIKYKPKYRYVFKNEKDAMLFSLRWL